ncbi:AraC family transcriptional regulator [Vibrio coralliilyticus]|uniref:AraC family transcriptional regulator n=1 Tax=Vibrio coralliilyticus TaxID=190893 RepID=UPI000810C290|nr:AraC family transcriptional regulator [Vibrio coralliilyticus]ANW25984.1 AraC family transcriptional regulator [Vibrio coralliilyticus]
MLENNLTIRAYTRQRRGHAHEHHQLVLPILGTIIIELEGYQGKVSVGECVVIQANTFHHFRAKEAARFIVADLNTLPENLLDMDTLVFPISSPLQSYLTFVESQLQHRVTPSIEEPMVDMFMKLLAEQQAGQQLDHRIRAVLHHIEEDLSKEITVDNLAKVACLSPTQFKKIFKQSTGLSVLQYVTKQRMEKAKALLTHTDIPVQLIAERVGYADLSAFSRRFSTSFGLSPRELRG